MRRFGSVLLRVAFAFRMVMLVASFGAMVGAFLMFYQGALYLAEAWNILIGGEAAAPAPIDAQATALVIPGEGGPAAPDIVAEEHGVSQVTVPVLEAVDSFLFGVVLVIFCYSIAVGFVFRLPAGLAAIVPTWMKVDGVGQLKQILAEVVVVILVVIFARVVVESGGALTWDLLVLPVSIILIAAAIWLLELGSHEAVSTSKAAQHHAPEPVAPIPPAPPTAGAAPISTRPYGSSHSPGDH